MEIRHHDGSDAHAGGLDASLKVVPWSGFCTVARTRAFSG